MEHYNAKVVTEHALLALKLSLSQSAERSAHPTRHLSTCLHVKCGVLVISLPLPPACRYVAAARRVQSVDHIVYMHGLLCRRCSRSRVLLVDNSREGILEV